MSEDELDFERRLRAIFAQEAEDHLRQMAAALGRLPQAAEAERRALVETVHREAHTLKGAARSVGVAGAEAVCRALEALFASAKQGGASRLSSDEAVAALLEVLDDLAALTGPAGSGAAPDRVMAAIRKVEAIPAADPAPREAPDPSPIAQAAAGPDASSPVAGRRTAGTDLPIAAVAAAAAASRTAAAAPGVRQPSGEPVAPDTVRVAAPRLEAVLAQAECLLAVKLGARERATALGECHALLASWQRGRAAARPSLLRLQSWLAGAEGLTPGPAAALRRVQALFADEDRLLAALAPRLAALARDASRDGHELGTLVDGLLDEVTQVLMLPCAGALAGLARMVRGLARELGKEVEFRLEGGEVEVDRRVIEEARGALLHLLRNAVDHGIEFPAERTAAGKPRRGTIVLDVAAVDGRWVEFAVADDGRGFDRAAIAAAAVRRGLAREDDLARRSAREIEALVLESGLTTRPAASDLSGQGLGAAIALETAERLGGTLGFESRPGAGVTFRLRLPLALTRFDGLMVRAGGATCVLPLSGVERVQRLAQAEVRVVEDERSVLVQGEPLSLIELTRLLGLPPAAAGGGPLSLVVVVAGGERLAVIVDEVLGVQEVLVKALAPPLDRIPALAAATVLGNGEVVPILLPADLLRTARDGAPGGALAAREARPPAAPRHVLVVEDSLTARALLKNVLHAGGYRVTTAVDGLDGLEKLRAGRFDVVVSDVEMPRMDGFELTARVRADPELARLPVVLVTSLESAADRARGIDVGASAYLGKSRFDQDHLLEALRGFA